MSVSNIYPIAPERGDSIFTRGMNQDIHPDCVEAFTQGLGAVFRQWTALELAVHNQWGGKTGSNQ